MEIIRNCDKIDELLDMKNIIKARIKEIDDYDGNYYNSYSQGIKKGYMEMLTYVENRLKELGW